MYLLSRTFASLPYSYPCTNFPLLMLLLLLSRFSHVWLCATLQTAAHQAPPSLGLSRQEHCSGLPFPSPMHESEVAQLCPTPSDPMDCSLPGSPVHGIFQARVLELSAIAFSRHLLYSQTNPVKDLFISYFNDYKNILTGHLFFHSCSPTACFLLIRQNDPTKTSCAQVTDMP